MSILERTRQLLLSPRAAWPVIAESGERPQQVMTGHVAPLAALSALAGFIGMSLVGVGAFGLSVRVPVLAVSAEGDRQDPPAACDRLLRQFGSATREHLCLGPRNGFSSPFGHVEMLISKAAQREVWPLLVDWLHRQVSEAAEPQGRSTREALC